MTDVHFAKMIAARRARANEPNTNENRSKASWKSGWRKIGGQTSFFRSRWEANYARYLEEARKQGKIKSWQHEPYVFWFDGIRRGVCSYKPDFRVITCDNRIVWREVKGWMDARSITTIKRMAKFFPAETVQVIDKEKYRELEKKWKWLIPDWETTKGAPSCDKPKPETAKERSARILAIEAALYPSPAPMRRKVARSSKVASTPDASPKFI